MIVYLSHIKYMDKADSTGSTPTIKYEAFIVF